MNDVAFFSLHSSKNNLEDRLLRDTLDFSKVHGRGGVLLSWRWHFFLGTLPLLSDGDAQLEACHAFHEIWVRQWEEAGRRLDRTLRGAPQRKTRTVKFDESTSTSSSSDGGDDNKGEVADQAEPPVLSAAASSPLSSGATENPLMPVGESSYALQFQVDAVRQTVAKDMSRLFWDVPLFREVQTKEIVSDILLKYCVVERREYKQGFHELVAFLYYACHRDKVLGERLARENPALRNNPYFALFEQVYANLPAAVYALFRRMIAEEDGGLGLARWYYVENLKEQSGVVVACERVQQDLLAQVAPELQHLMDAEYDIQSVVYLVRWLRLLFVRELPFDQLLQVWTVVFCERYVQTGAGRRMYLLDDSVALYFATQMLLHIRVPLSADAGTALQLLMRYPPVEHVEELLYRAIMTNADSCLTRLATAPRMVSAVDAVALPAEVTARQGEIVAGVIKNLEQYWFCGDKVTAEELQCMTECYIQSVAQLKKVRDVLLYGVED
jgi:TBC1 domain family member 5